ncbi:MAG: hypothetical protein AB1758_21705, partial [Candidatus Eremiobacterota bacterium]
TVRIPEGEFGLRAPEGYEPIDMRLPYPGIALRKADRVLIVQVLDPDSLEEEVLADLHRRAQSRGLKVAVGSPASLDLSRFPGAQRAMAVSQDGQTGILALWMVRRLSTGQRKGYAIASLFESNPGWPQLMAEAEEILAGVQLPP